MRTFKFRFFSHFLYSSIVLFFAEPYFSSLAMTSLNILLATYCISLPMYEEEKKYCQPDYV